MLKEFQKQYGKLDGAYWWAVKEYREELGFDLTLGKQPHRVHSEFKKGYVILRNVFDKELGRFQYEKQSKGTSERKGKRSNSKSK